MDNAKAAMELIKRVINVATIVTKTELFRHLIASKSIPATFFVGMTLGPFGDDFGRLPLKPG